MKLALIMTCLYLNILNLRCQLEYGVEGPLIMVTGRRLTRTVFGHATGDNDSVVAIKRLDVILLLRTRRPNSGLDMYREIKIGLILALNGPD